MTVPRGSCECPGDLSGRVLEDVAEHDHAHGAQATASRARRAARPSTRSAAAQALRGLPAARARSRSARRVPVTQSIERLATIAEQPRPERFAAVEAVQPADRGQERLLGDVLGGGVVVHDQERAPVGARPVAVKEQLQVGLRAGERAGDQRPLAATPHAGAPLGTPGRLGRCGRDDAVCGTGHRFTDRGHRLRTSSRIRATTCERSPMGWTSGRRRTV